MTGVRGGRGGFGTRSALAIAGNRRTIKGENKEDYNHRQVRKGLHGWPSLRSKNPKENMFPNSYIFPVRSLKLALFRNRRFHSDTGGRDPEKTDVGQHTPFGAIVQGSFCHFSCLPRTPCPFLVGGMPVLIGYWMLICPGTHLARKLADNGEVSDFRRPKMMSE